MTEPTATTASADTTDTQQETAEQQTGTEQQQETDTGNSEAARYRRQLRDTETTLSTTATRLATYQRRAAEQVIADVVATPGDLFDIGGMDVSTFIDDDTGDIRTDELTEAAQAFVALRPQLGANYHPPVHFEHGPMGGPVYDGPSWAKALDPQRRV